MGKKLLVLSLICMPLFGGEQPPKGSEVYLAQLAQKLKDSQSRAQDIEKLIKDLELTAGTVPPPNCNQQQ